MITPQYPLVGFVWDLPIKEDIPFKFQLLIIPVHALEICKTMYPYERDEYETIGYIGGRSDNIRRINEDPGFVCVNYTSISEKFKWTLIYAERRRRGWKYKPHE